MIGDGMAFVSPEFIFHPQEEDNRPPPDFHGASISPAQMRRSMSFSGFGTKCEESMIMNVEDDMSDDGYSFQLGEKKRRLSVEQVKALEKSFEVGNKLEPERKVQLARALGLQPRQVAIWFQNRRARWKTKQLERDYDVLKRKFEALKADNDSLQAQNKNLHAELLALKGREPVEIGPINLNKEIDGSWSNGCVDKCCDVSLSTIRTPPTSVNPFYSHHSNRSMFASLGATNVTHLLQSSSRSDGSQCPKIDQTVPDESLCNMLISGINDQSSFWPWPEQQNLH